MTLTDSGSKTLGVYLPTLLSRVDYYERPTLLLFRDLLGWLLPSLVIPIMLGPSTHQK